MEEQYYAERIEAEMFYLQITLQRLHTFIRYIDRLNIAAATDEQT